jgi:5-(carboxyamino)imidazole ribonucleotide synthase
MAHETNRYCDGTARVITIGILGGGQLGRMTAIAAANLGYKTHIYCPETDCPASYVSSIFTCADYTDIAALDTFARSVDVITFEFENIPHESLLQLQAIKSVYPQPAILQKTQDRVLEKNFVQSCGIATAPYQAVNSLEDLQTAVAALDTPCVLKTRTLGYDGKGQYKIADNAPATLTTAWAAMHGQHAILEGFIEFSCEISVVAARTQHGEIALYAVTENSHKNHVLDESVVPARISDAVRVKAEAIAHTLAEAFDLVGVLAIEMFVTGAGDVLVNELAPRPHNSGHWTIDGAMTSQFEQLVRCVLGLPLGATTPRAPQIRMKNLLGEDALNVLPYLRNPNAKLHLYGKAEAKAGRKMGHVTIIHSNSKTKLPVDES